MKNVLVTGCAGFIASHLAEALIKEGCTVWGIDNFYPYYSPSIKKNNLENIKKTAEEYNGTFNFVEGSILKTDDLAKIPNDLDTVFHLAAIAGVRNSIEDPIPYFQINVEGTVRLLKKFKKGKFIFASSSSVYGDVPEEELPVSEDRTLTPICPYALSKKTAEEVCEMFSEIYGTPIAALRFYTVYGPRQRPDEAFTKFIRASLKGEPITIYGNGEQTRDFTYVGDIVKGNILAAKNLKSGFHLYNLGSCRRVSVNDMVKNISDLIDTKITNVPPPKGDVRNTHANISKAKKELGFEPTMPLKEGTKACIEWCKKSHKKGLFD